MSTFWKLEQSVGRGYYIVLEGIYTTEQAAQTAASRLRSNEGIRPVLYQTGGWRGGAVRAEAGEWRAA